MLSRLVIAFLPRSKHLLKLICRIKLEYTESRAHSRSDFFHTKSNPKYHLNPR